MCLPFLLRLLSQLKPNLQSQRLLLSLSQRNHPPRRLFRLRRPLRSLLLQRLRPRHLEHRLPQRRRNLPFLQLHRKKRRRSRSHWITNWCKG